MNARPNGKPVVYLDSASSSQKPQPVLDAMEQLYETTYANVHRGVYELGAETTERYEGARAAVARFIGAGSEREIIFTKNVTEAINLVAYTWGRANLHEGDVVVLSHLEHHANVVPWLMLQQERGIEIRWIPARRRLHARSVRARPAGRRREVRRCVGHVERARHASPPCERSPTRLTPPARCASWTVRRRVPHLPTDVGDLGCDFLGFTGHKMLGPTGIGVLWGRPELLDAMPPFLGGGEMIRDVRLDGFTTNEVPWKFEAGTPPIAEAVGLGRAVEYLEALGMDNIRAHEVHITDYALRTLTERFGEQLTIHGPTDVTQRGGVLSLAFRDVHPHDVSQVLDQHGVCVRAGHHCAKPLMRLLGVSATARASFYLYNDESDVDALADALADAAEFFMV